LRRSTDLFLVSTSLSFFSAYINRADAKIAVTTAANTGNVEPKAATLIDSLNLGEVTVVV